MATLQTGLHVVEQSVYGTVMLQVMGYLNCAARDGELSRCLVQCLQEFIELVTHLSTYKNNLMPLFMLGMFRDI
jgi:hypothetical protein